MRNSGRVALFGPFVVRNWYGKRWTELLEISVFSFCCATGFGEFQKVFRFCREKKQAEDFFLNLAQVGTVWKSQLKEAQTNVEFGGRTRFLSRNSVKIWRFQLQGVPENHFDKISLVHSINYVVLSLGINWGCTKFQVVIRWKLVGCPS